MDRVEQDRGQGWVERDREVEQDRGRGWVERDRGRGRVKRDRGQGWVEQDQGLVADPLPLDSRGQVPQKEQDLWQRR